MIPDAGRVRSARAASLAGAAVAFVVGVDLARWVRPALLIDPDPAWSLPRLFLGLFVIGAAVGAGGLTSALFLLLARRISGRFSPVLLPLRGGILVAIAAAAIGLGTLARFVALERLPPSLWIDDISLIASGASRT